MQKIFRHSQTPPPITELFLTLVCCKIDNLLGRTHTGAAVLDEDKRTGSYVGLILLCAKINNVFLKLSMTSKSYKIMKNVDIFCKPGEKLKHRWISEGCTAVIKRNSIHVCDYMHVCKHPWLSEWDKL